MNRLRPWHALLLLPLAGAAFWLVQRSRTVRDDPAAVLAALRAAAGPTLPEAGAARATARSELSSYDRETLYEYIDGAAEAYLSRGFERCAVATYTFALEGGASLDVTAEVYRFGSSTGAREQLESERPSAAKPVSALPDAFADPTTLVSARGADYLKLTALGAGGATSDALASIAAAWSKGRP